MTLAVAVIATVLNEGESLRRLLDSLAAQTQPPAEVVIVDGGSQDDTLAILESYQGRLPLRILRQPGANISQGRNAAIAAASAPLIAATDAGVRLAPDWLARLTAPLQADAAVHVVSGFFLPECTNAFELAMSAAVLPLAEELRPAHFLPSSRSVAFRKAAWERVGGYPEWLDYCEDLVYDLRLKAVCGPFALVPQAVVYFRPRGSLRGYWTQYLRYARGDGKADLWRRRHAVRYATYLGGLLLLLLAAVHHPVWLLLALAGFAAYMAPLYRRLFRLWPPFTLAQRLSAAAWVPLIRVVGDLAKMLGYPVGWLWRWRHHPPAWRL